MSEQQTKPKGPQPESYALAGTEHAHQVALFMKAAQHFDKYPVLRFMFAIPNGGLRNIITASNLKAEGAKAGVPDIFLPVPVGTWHGLFIELKRPKSKGKSVGVISDDQVKWHQFLQSKGYGVIVAYSWDQAWKSILQYLNWKPECE